MKKITAIAGLLWTIAVSAQSLNDTLAFVANFYTGQSNTMSGSYSKKTGAGEKGSIIFKASGNLKYIITPADFQIQPNEDKSWQGFLMPDNVSIPLPGTSEEAWFSGNYDITYKSTNPEDPMGDPIVKNATGTQTLHFVIYSMNVDFSCPEIISLFPGQVFTVHANPFPTGGQLTWNDVQGLNMVGDANNNAIQISPLTGINHASIKITYELKGVTFSKTLQVNILQPVFPETILIDSGVVLFDLFPNSDQLSFEFTSSNERFAMKSGGNDAVLLSLNPAVSGISEDPFAAENPLFQNNRQLGYEYPNLSPLMAGQDESAALPAYTQATNEEQPSSEKNNSTNESFLMGSTPVTIQPDRTFSRPIRIALKSNPSVTLGTISVSLAR